MKKKFALAILLIAMVLSAFNFSALADSENSTEDVSADNFVLLLDCSMTMNSNDRDNLCIKACKNFIDTIPTENANVSVIAFGYKAKTDDDVYRFSSKLASTVGMDRDRVHVIVPLTELSDPAKKENYKSIIEETSNTNRTNTDTYTPIGYALAAAVDMLEQQGAKDNKAAIVIVSDGIEESNTPDVDEALLDQASKLAGEHSWNIYGVELNYSLGNKKMIQQADTLFDTVCGNSASEKVGRVSCANPIDVYVALQSIFADYFDLDGQAPEMISLPASEDFVIPQLASETTINIFGTEISSVTLTNNDTGTTATYTESIANDNVTVSVEKGSYFSIKLICPEAGNWTIYIDGTNQAKAYFNTVTLQEMGIKMTTKANLSGASLTKQDSITVDACFSYEGKDQLNNKFYEANPGILEVTCADGTVKTVTMSADSNGYHTDLPLSDISSGEFKLRVIVKNAMFRGGEKSSEYQKYSLGNLELYLKDNPASIDLTAYANSSFDAIDLNSLFINPDNDTIEVMVTDTNNPEDVFPATVTDSGLVIETGNHSGDYNVTILAKDPEMDYYVSCPATLHVENRAPKESKSLSHTTLVLNPYPFDKTANTELAIDLDDYIKDPDGLPLTYAVTDGSIVNVSQDGSNLVITPVTKGDDTVIITASDGVNTSTFEMQLKVADGKAVYWQHYSVFYIIALVILAVIAIVIFILFKNKRVKGSWNITIEENGVPTSISPFDISSFTTCGRKSKFQLSEVIPEILPFCDQSDGVANQILLNLGNYTTGTSAVTLIGVFGRQGLGVKFDQRKVGMCRTTVNCNGTIVTKSSAMKTGYFEVTVSDENGNTLKFKMDSNLSD